MTQARGTAPVEFGYLALNGVQATLSSLPNSSPLVRVAAIHRLDKLGPQVLTAPKFQQVVIGPQLRCSVWL
ncbi:hypothetical protein FRB95_011048 [Tulasnella sp. JGI-2019a]|nr:hypothetical protein FRB95_011048 [Tulasnella sp. JGI-2019a]